jgi:hypothetical protein
MILNKALFGRFNVPFLGFMMGSVIGLTGCGDTPKDDSSLTLQGLPATLKVGDTTATLTCSKATRDLAGRMQTNKNYNQFYLVSSDTTTLGIISDRQAVGLKGGTATLYAKDKSGNLSSDAQSVQVQ